MTTTSTPETKKPRSEVESILKEESHFFGKKIKEFGVADKIINSSDEITAESEINLINAAKVEFEACSEKIKSHDEQFDQIAAFLTDSEFTNLKPEAGTGKTPGKIKRESVPPNNSNEVELMDWEEFFNQAPEAKAKLDTLLLDAMKYGADEAKATHDGKITRITNILESDAYDKKHKKLAVKAIKNENTAAARMQGRPRVG